MKKIGFILYLLILLVSALSGSATVVGNLNNLSRDILEGEGTQESPYLVSSLDDLS